MRRKRQAVILYWLIGISLGLLVLLTSVELAAFDLAGHMKLMERYQVPAVTGLTIQQLEPVMEDVLLYFKDSRVLLDTTVTKAEGTVPAFGERAVQHMVDVKALFVGGRWIRNLSIGLLIVLLVITRNDPAKYGRLKRTLAATGGLGLFLMGLLFLLMQLDFYRYFVYFHQIFFSNDLWILDPATELMIQMLPEGFFMDTAFKIGAYFVGGNGIMVVGALLMHLNQKRFGLKRV